MSAVPSPDRTSVTTIGLHIVDVLGRHVARIPPGQSVDLIDEIRMTVAGTAAATAVDLAKLGVAVTTVGVVGDDDLGRWVRATMAGHGVDVAHLATGALQTSATMLPIRPNGERPALHVPGANSLLAPEHVPDEVLTAAAVVHVGGSCLLPGLDGAPTADLLSRARAAGAVTTLDLIGLPDADHEAVFGPVYPHLDYFLPNEEDALLLSGRSTVADAVRWFADRGVGTSVVTRGEQGAYAAGAGGGPVTVAAHAVDVVDTTGCGDAFSAGFIAGLVSGLDLAGAVELGVAAGSLVATGLGSDAGIVDRAHLAQFLATTGRR